MDLEDKKNEKRGNAECEKNEWGAPCGCDAPGHSLVGGVVALQLLNLMRPGIFCALIQLLWLVHDRVFRREAERQVKGGRSRRDVGSGQLWLLALVC